MSESWILTAALTLCGAVGLAISAYFTLVTWRWIPADAPFIPRFCRLQRATCQQILDTPQARLFGIPNSLLGVVFYLALLAVLLGGSGESVGVVLMLASAATVLVGLYLTWSLMFVLRVRCPLCLASHALNALILLLLLGAF